MPLCACILTTTTASAQQDVPKLNVQLEFQAPPDCATVQQFVSQVQVRSDRILFVGEASSDGSAKVILSRRADEVLVRLAWRHDNAGMTLREFSAPDCDQALSAAALVIAISFDPTAPTSTLPDAGTPAPDAGEQASRNDDRPAADEAATGAPLAPDPNAEETPGGDGGATMAPSTARTPLKFSTTALVEGVQGVAPTTLEGLGLSMALAFGRGLLAPQLRLVLVHFFGVTYPAQGGDAHFELDAGRLMACPIRLGPEQYSLRPCAMALGGRLQASGHNTQNQQSHTRALWVFGGSLLANYRPSSVLLVSAELGLGAPLSRDSFQFAPDEFHQIAQVIWTASFGLGIELP